MSFSSITVILLLIFVWFVTYINILKLTTIKHIHFRLDSSYYMITIIFFCLIIIRIVCAIITFHGFFCLHI